MLAFAGPWLPERRSSPHQTALAGRVFRPAHTRHGCEWEDHTTAFPAILASASLPPRVRPPVVLTGLGPAKTKRDSLEAPSRAPPDWRLPGCGASFRTTQPG